MATPEQVPTYLTNLVEHYPKYPHYIDPEVPEHFSAISAQKDENHNEVSHKTLRQDLVAHGFTPTETEGKYGYHEKSYMVPHDGSEAKMKIIEELGKKHGQDSVVHSTTKDGERHNTLSYSDGRKEYGKGMTHGPFLDDYYSQLPSGHRVHLFLGNAGEVKKSDELEKAFKQPDGETITDTKSHGASSSGLPKALMDFGSSELSVLKPDAVASLELNGNIIKVRKHSEDQYSGWIEKNGNIIHQFERLTMPELMTQIQSKLELYGKEEEVVAGKKDTVEMPKQEFIDEHKNLVNVLESPSHADDIVEANKQKEELKEKTGISLDSVEQKLSDLTGKIKAYKDENKVEIAGKEMLSGIENPETICPACERPVSKCICYTGLSAPRIEFDTESKKFTIFFKSEWDEEAKEAFVSDLKRRAGRVIEKRRLEKAQGALDELRKRFKK